MPTCSCAWRSNSSDQRPSTRVARYVITPDWPTRHRVPPRPEGPKAWARATRPARQQRGARGAGACLSSALPASHGAPARASNPVGSANQKPWLRHRNGVPRAVRDATRTLAPRPGAGPPQTACDRCTATRAPVGAQTTRTQASAARLGRSRRRPARQVSFVGPRRMDMDGHLDDVINGRGGARRPTGPPTARSGDAARL